MAKTLNGLSATDMPNGDTEACMWLRAFTNTLAAQPSRYGIEAAASAELSALVAEFERRLQVASSPVTRTAEAVRQKTLARNAAVLAVRAIIKAVKANPAVSDIDRMSLGLTTVEQRKRRRQRQKRRYISIGAPDHAAPACGPAHLSQGP